MSTSPTYVCAAPAETGERASAETGQRLAKGRRHSLPLSSSFSLLLFRCNPSAALACSLPPAWTVLPPSLRSYVDEVFCVARLEVLQQLRLAEVGERGQVLHIPRALRRERERRRRDRATVREGVQGSGHRPAPSCGGSQRRARRSQPRKKKKDRRPEAQRLRAERECAESTGGSSAGSTRASHRLCESNSQAKGGTMGRRSAGCVATHLL